MQDKLQQDLQAQPLAPSAVWSTLISNIGRGVGCHAKLQQIKSVYEALQKKGLLQLRAGASPHQAKHASGMDHDDYTTTGTMSSPSQLSPRKRPPDSSWDADMNSD